MSCDTVGLCGNCDKYGGPESRPKYEAVKQSRVGTSRASIIDPMLRHHAQAVAWHAAWCKACFRCQSNLAVGEGGGARLRMLIRLVRGQVSGARKRFHM